MKSSVRVVVALVLIATPSSAQVEARKANPDEVAALERGPDALADVEVENPMLLEVRLAPIGNRRGPGELEPGRGGWFTNETGRFVCDRAKLARVYVQRLKNRKGNAVFSIELMLTSGWYRQDVDVTATVFGADGRPRAQLRKDDLSIGNDGGPYAATTKKPSFELALPEDQVAAFFDAENPPILKVVVEIQGEEGDAGDD